MTDRHIEKQTLGIGYTSMSGFLCTSKRTLYKVVSAINKTRQNVIDRVNLFIVTYR